MTPRSVPESRVRPCNTAQVRPDGQFVLYWMIAFRRATWNFALDRAVEWAEKLGKPLVVLEALRSDYQWANDRIHRFILDGMAENARRFADAGVLHYPFLEVEPKAGRGLLRAISSHACVVVTDDFPCFFLPRMVASAGAQVPVRMEAIDSNGLLPLKASDQTFLTAYAFRRFLQKKLPTHLVEFPQADALKKAALPAAAKLPREITDRWPSVSPPRMNSGHSFLATLPVNHNVPPVSARGGTTAAEAHLKGFLENKLKRYVEDRNEPDLNVASGLSPYLHFGHISAHQIFSEITEGEGWSVAKLPVRATGSRAGWWGLSPSAEAFLDQLITWRELGFNFASRCNDDHRFSSLPEWAQKTLGLHARDERAYLYTLEQLEQALTHDPLWNAAQRQLVTEGTIHNYLRMLWGKKILEWTPSPTRALEIMVELNNKYALDGRDPNSYSGIFWCLGRYDRPWGPERPVFGTVRFMSSANTAKKLHVANYLREYGPASERGKVTTASLRRDP